MRTLAVALAGVLAGCAAPAPHVVHITAAFDEAAALAQMEAGQNSIEGSALIRQNGGGVVTCAGAPVFLIPATGYATSRLLRMYGFGKYVPAPYPRYEYDPNPPGYERTIRKTTCNAQGFFTFDNVKDGAYFVQTAVVWKVGYNIQGGALLERVSVASGKRVEVTMTP